MNWLNNLLEQHSELESPRSFWYWGALTAISAVVKDNVYLDKFLYKLYPNIYVMFHADSGLKKGPPVSMAKQLVKECNNTTIVTGRSSIQGILKRLGTVQTMPGGKIEMKSSAFICSSELTSSIVDDKAAADILTDLYDRHYNQGDWESLLKMEQFKLKSPIISMLTATNEAHSDEFFQKKDIQGGYFARTFIIFEKQAQAVNSLMFPLKYEIDYKKLAVYLKELAKLRGPMEISDDTRKYFNDWYISFKESIKGTKDSTGTLNRFDDSILKVAILISLANAPELIITQASVEEAIKECEKLIGNVRHTTMSRGKSQWTQEKALAINELLDRDNHAISREQLNKKYWMRANSSEWDEIMTSLQVAGIVQIEQHGNQIIYTMPNKQVEEWKKHLRGK